MKKINNRWFSFGFIQAFLVFSSMHFFMLSVSAVELIDEPDDHEEQSSISESAQKNNQIIQEIVVEGNKYVTTAAILNRLPYKVGQPFDQEKSSLAINNLYGLGNFRQVHLEGASHADKGMTLFVTVEEKKLLEKIEFKGNKAIKTKKIKEKLNIEKLAAIDEETLSRIANNIKKMYREENRHLANVSYELTPNKENPDKVAVVFTTTEGPKSIIKRVYFVGNDHMLSRKLRHILLTKENWILNFMDNAGAYNEEMLEMDKHRIEYFYRDHGYMMAKVAKANVEFSEDKKDIAVTFYIKEGNLFTIRELHVVGDEIHDEAELMPLVQLESGAPYSQNKLVGSMNKIKDLYGEKGYIYCDVYPQVKPDEATDEVDITFNIERGKKPYVNRIDITGNKVTRDKVIRRQLELVEGDLITTRKLNQSQSAVEYLSYFEKDGAVWKVHRISDELADLEMNVREAKTGNINLQMTYGTDQYNPKQTLRAMVSVEKNNLMGQGWDVGGLVQADRHRARRIEAHFFDPHIFDSDISTGLFFYKRWDEYEQWKSLDRTPVQKILGGNVRLGFWLPQIDKRLQMVFDVGIEDIKTNKPQLLKPVGGSLEKQRQYTAFLPIVNRTFQEGTLKWLGLELTKDTRDHQVYPKSGYKISVGSKIAPPGLNHQFSYLKTEMEASFYTALIDKFIMDDSLVLGLRAKLGNIRSLSQECPVPYKELFHMGGQTTVRGFVWGSIGPAWGDNESPLGARHAIQFNSELIFPLVPDYAMKAHIFYDMGAGWDTPKNDITQKSLIMRDKFDLRHSIGFGLNLTKPVPAKIDWGFKLDRKKNRHESPSEFHLNMNMAW